MRLDRFLKVSRLVKRRTLAKDLADAGRVTVNGRPAKPSTDVEPGDRLVLDFAGKVLTVDIVEVRSSVRAQDAAKLYRVLSENMKDSG